MEPYKISSNSIIGKFLLNNSLEVLYICYPLNICSLIRKFIAGVFIYTAIYSFIIWIIFSMIILLFMIPDTHYALMYADILTVMTVSGIFGWCVLILGLIVKLASFIFNTWLDKINLNLPRPKRCSIISLWIKSIREKICFHVEFD